jgi:hypothetical protein
MRKTRYWRGEKRALPLSMLVFGLLLINIMANDTSLLGWRVARDEHAPSTKPDQCRYILKARKL